MISRRKFLVSTALASLGTIFISKLGAFISLTPVEFDVDLDPDDFDDLTQSAFGFGGFVTNGKWMTNYSFGQLELGDDTRVVLPSGDTVSAELGFDITGGELTVGYPIYRGTSLTVRLLAGARYTKHELKSDITIVSGIGTTRLNIDIDEDWTDGLVGISAGVSLA